MLSVVLQIGTPSPNTEFLFAAFAITGIVFLGYSALFIWLNGPIIGIDLRTLLARSV